MLLKCRLNVVLRKIAVRNTVTKASNLLLLDRPACSGSRSDDLFVAGRSSVIRCEEGGGREVDHRNKNKRLRSSICILLNAGGLLPCTSVHRRAATVVRPVHVLRRCSLHCAGGCCCCCSEITKQLYSRPAVEAKANDFFVLRFLSYDVKEGGREGD